MAYGGPIIPERIDWRVIEMKRSSRRSLTAMSCSAFLAVRKAKVKAASGSLTHKDLGWGYSLLFTEQVAMCNAVYAT